MTETLRGEGGGVRVRVRSATFSLTVSYPQLGGLWAHRERLGPPQLSCFIHCMDAVLSALL